MLTCSSKTLNIRGTKMLLDFEAQAEEDTKPRHNSVGRYKMAATRMNGGQESARRKKASFPGEVISPPFPADWRKPPELYSELYQATNNKLRRMRRMPTLRTAYLCLQGAILIATTAQK